MGRLGNALSQVVVPGAQGAEFADDALAFFHGEDAIGRRETKLLNRAAGPVNLDLVDGRVVTQSEMSSHVVV